MTATAAWWNPSRLLERHERACGRLALALAAVPAAWLGADWAGDRLGANPLQRLEQDTGLWAFAYLLITLAVTPVRRLGVRLAIAADARHGRRLSDWNALVRLRRQFGLTCFAYAAVHVAVYAWFDAGWEWVNVAQDLAEKPYVVAGAVAFLFLVPLALTSHRAAMRRLGGRWRALHRLVYAIAILAALHFLWLAKPGLWLPVVYAAAVALLLGCRVLARLGIPARQAGDDGMEVAPRAPPPVRHPVTDGDTGVQPAPHPSVMEISGNTHHSKAFR